MPLNLITSVDETHEIMENIIISWSTPYDGGSPLLSFTILIREIDGVTFTEDQVNCLGSDSGILSSS